MPQSLMSQNKVKLLKCTDFKPEDIEIFTSDHAPLTKNWTGPTKVRQKRVTSVRVRVDKALDGRELADKCVRILLQEGEELLYDLDCMALTFKRDHGEGKELPQIDVKGFNWRGIMEEALEPLTPEVRGFIQDRITS